MHRDLDDVARADAGRTGGLAVRQTVGGGQPGTGTPSIAQTFRVKSSLTLPE